MMWWMMAFGWTAAADTLADQGYQQVNLNADPYIPPLGPAALNATDLPRVTAHTTVRADLRYTDSLLLWQNNVEGQTYTLLKNLTTLHVAAGRGNEHWRVGLGVPLHRMWGSDLFDDKAFVAGDLRASLKYRPGSAPVAVDVAYSLPLSGDSYLLGTSGGVLDATLIAGIERPNLSAGLNVGGRFQPTVTIVNEDASFDFGNHIRAQTGLGVAVWNGWDATVEALSNYAPSSYVGQSFEAMVGARRRAASGQLIRLAVGVGLGSGIGAPAFRLQVGLGQALTPAVPLTENTAPPSENTDTSAPAVVTPQQESPPAVESGAPEGNTTTDRAEDAPTDTVAPVEATETTEETAEETSEGTPTATQADDPAETDVPSTP